MVRVIEPVEWGVFADLLIPGLGYAASGSANQITLTVQQLCNAGGSLTLSSGE
ncbi:hypothetical protein [Paenibacillus macerans]|nr:hypothetical protein [Paenibacillus macerans]